MTSYTEVFGGGTIYPAEPTFLSLTFAANVILQWPIEQAVGGDDIAAKIINLHPAGAGLSVAFSDAREVSTGYTATFANLESNTVTIKDQGGNTIMTVASGLVWTAYLTSNSTANGTWSTFQQGAGSSTANAAALAGAGLKAITTTLNVNMPPTTHSTNYVIVEADRANPQVWTGGVGAYTLPSAAAVTTGWYVPVSNQGTGSVTITPPSGTIDGGANLVLALGESAFIVSDATNYFTIGLGQQVNSVFDYISVNVAGTGNYTLSGPELNRIAYNLTGILTGNRNILVPSTVQQYWVTNATTGAFTLTVKTALGTGVTIAQGAQQILYCNGTDVVPAESVAVTTPVQVAQGGTGLTSGTAFGLPYFASTTTMASTAAGTTTTLLHGNAAGAPTFGAVSLATDTTGNFTDGQRFPDGSAPNPGIGFASEDTGFTRTSTTLNFVVNGVIKGSWTGADDFFNYGASNLNFAAGAVAGLRYLGTNVGGDPEGAITAITGSVYPSSDGGQQQGLYFKQSGSGNTGWRQAMLGRNAWANITSAGAVAGTAFNVTSITHVGGTGIYTVNYTTAFDAAPVPIVCPRESSALVYVNTVNLSNVVVHTTDLAGVPTDKAFAVFVAGGI